MKHRALGAEFGDRRRRCGEDDSCSGHGSFSARAGTSVPSETPAGGVCRSTPKRDPEAAR
eukprot:365245-Chlamydomonas_euryale.AAC.5